MSLKKLVFCSVFLIISLGYSQTGRIDEFGKPTQKEFNLKTYEPEPDAAGVILYESGNYYAIPLPRKTSARLVKEVHRKIKVFDAKKFDYATVEIPYHSGYYYKDEIKDYKAVTHNGSVQSFVPNTSFYKTNEPGIGNVLRFTFPNVKDGSILEYSYTIISPFFFDLDGWDFQHGLPTLYSQFKTNLPLYFRYKRALYGNKKLSINKSVMVPDGFRLPSNSGNVETEFSVYAIKNIPSFKEEKYMLSKKNYISRIAYEPIMFIDFFGNSRTFSRTWEDVDKYFKNDEDFGEQLGEKKYFKRKLPDSIFDEKNELKKAKKIYTFIKNHFTWNGYNYSADSEIRDSYDEKVGSVAEINLSLINALKAGKLDAKLMLLSTRKNGLPVEEYPVLSNFNYILAILTIDNKKYILDATDRLAPFGIIPYRALNFHGRVMDFKKGSYWLPIVPYKKNILYINTNIKADENGVFTGTVNQASYGYIGLEKRTDIKESTLAEFIKTNQNEKKGVEIDEYQVENLDKIDKPLRENYTISLEPETVGNKVFLYPFLNKTYISENPFRLDTRSYPMDFGFPFSNTYLVSIDLGSAYQVENLPKSRTEKLPGNDGECTVIYISKGNKINIRFNMKLNAYRFPPDAYQALKEYFSTMITMLKNEPITLKRL